MGVLSLRGNEMTVAISRWWKSYWDCFGAEAHSQTNELAVVKYLLCESTNIGSSVTLAAGVKPLPYNNEY